MLGVTSLTVNAKSEVPTNFDKEAKEEYKPAWSAWVNSETRSPEEYLKQLDLSLENVKAIQKSEFVNDQIIELEGLMLAKSEVAVLAQMYCLLCSES